MKQTRPIICHHCQAIGFQIKLGVFGFDHKYDCPTRIYELEEEVAALKKEIARMKKESSNAI